MSGNSRDLMSAGTGSDVPLETLLPRRKIVVAIGIDEYRSLPTLRCAVSDACRVQELLVRHFGFEAPLAPLTNQAATKRAIEALVEDYLPKLLTTDDALIFFFAGHGTTRLARLEGVTVEAGYLVPVEARGSDVFSEFVDMEQLLRKLGMLPAHHILVVLDACHSGMALGSSVVQYRSVGAYVHRLAANRSRRVITSARRDEPALDSGPVPGHSLFTGALIHGLTSGQADLDHNGVITFSELALCLQQWVGQASGSRQLPDYGAFHLDDRGELVLAMRYGAPGQATWGPALGHGQRQKARPSRRRWGIAAAVAGTCALAGLGITLGANLLLGGSTPKPSPSAPATASAAPAGPCSEGVASCRAACDKGQQDACVAFGQLLHEGKGIGKDPQTAFQLFKKACDKGQSEGCREAGLDLVEGTGVLKDAAAGAALVAKSCKLRLPLGCYSLGLLQRHGEGVPKNGAAAVASFHNACEGGTLRGCVWEGQLVRDGEGVAKDAAKAVSLFQRACDGKDGEGCNLLGYSYLNGEGVAKDAKRAAVIFQQGCDYGSAKACYALGHAYQQGTGVAADKAHATELFTKACNGGFQPACDAGKPKSTAPQSGGSKSGGPKEGASCSGHGSWGMICGGYCINVIDNAYNCGKCGNVCSGQSPKCRSGQCVPEWWQ